jgi:hypothetical protein
MQRRSRIAVNAGAATIFERIKRNSGDPSFQQLLSEPEPQTISNRDVHCARASVDARLSLRKLAALLGRP